MVKAAFEEVHFHAGLHQVAGVIFYDARRNGNVTLGGDHNLDVNASSGGAFKGAFDMATKRQIGIDYLNAALSVLDGVNEGVVYDFRRGMRVAVDDSDGLLSCRLASVGGSIGKAWRASFSPG